MDYHGLFLLKGYKIFFFKIKKMVIGFFSLLELFFKPHFYLQSELGILSELNRSGYLNSIP